MMQWVNVLFLQIDGISRENGDGNEYTLSWLMLHVVTILKGQ